MTVSPTIWYGVGTRASRRHLTGRSASSTRRRTEKREQRKSKSSRRGAGTPWRRGAPSRGRSWRRRPPGKSGPWLCSAPRSSGGGGARGAPGRRGGRGRGQGGALERPGSAPRRPPCLASCCATDFSLVLQSTDYYSRRCCRLAAA